MTDYTILWNAVPVMAFYAKTAKEYYTVNTQT